ncbi:MAG: hypothetical protein BWX88_02428 [Planctomycetes bacterium ADurb.Bin126]|nr:MAG: hypothetical protein BWX88_02428 [Planctomycetes bacterium ADurb.Bin126]HOD81163.1 hypothetical protein [Phycisphaerae bacterium]HQL72425.1 hypothetical protein [Phycisphaerae bacterium]
MTQQPIKVKPQPNIYTVLIIVAILILGATVGLVMNNLMTPTEKGGYGLEFGMILDHSKLPPPVNVTK